MPESISTAQSARHTGHRLHVAFEWCPLAVVFDMDGLLFNTEQLARCALRRAAADVDLDLSESVCESMIGVPAEGCRQLLIQRYGENVPADALLAASTEYLNAKIDAGGIECMPGTHQLLAYLRHKSLPCAVATSSSREKTLHHMAAGGLLNDFDTVVTRSDVAHGKPFPDLYLEASRRLGFEPQQCLALEDSYNGVRAANAAGIPVIMVPDLLRPTQEMHDMCVAVLPDLLSVRDRLDRANWRDAATRRKEK